MCVGLRSRGWAVWVHSQAAEVALSLDLASVLSPPPRFTGHGVSLQPWVCGSAILTRHGAEMRSSSLGMQRQAEGQGRTRPGGHRPIWASCRGAHRDQELPRRRVTATAIQDKRPAICLPLQLSPVFPLGPEMGPREGVLGFILLPLPHPVMFIHTASRSRSRR